MNKIALVFPGQGSQYFGMGKNSLELSSFSSDLYAMASSILGYNIEEICLNSTLEEISNTKLCKM